MWSDRDIIFTLVEKYPNKTINLCRYYIHAEDKEEINWQEIINFNRLTQGNFIFGVSYVDELLECQKNGIKFYYLNPISTFRDLQGLKALGVCYVLIDAPLFFQMDKVKNIGIPVRATANLAVRTLLPYTDGVPGPWIRPEDIELYEEYIDLIEFNRVNLEQERALFRIYAQQHNWPGDLELIIQDLNYPGINRMIPSTLAEKRLNCAQRCQENNQCHLCWRMLDLANPDLLRDYQKNTQ